MTMTTSAAAAIGSVWVVRVSTETSSSLVVTVNGMCVLSAVATFVRPVVSRRSRPSSDSMSAAVW